MIINDLIGHLDGIAPFGLALSWDKSGLQIGSPESRVTKVLLTLDVTPAVCEHAIHTSANVIVTHHPLIFQSLDTITDHLLLKLIEHRIAVIAMHTNLDCTAQGVNHCLAKALGLRVIKPLSAESGAQWHHLSVTVPPDAVDEVRSAAFAAGAGRIGLYEGCSTLHGISGTFLPLPDASPYIGRTGQLEKVQEVELEMMVDSFRLNRVIAAISIAHPYETPALYHFPVANSNPAYGLGLICEDENERTIRDLIAAVQNGLGNQHPHIWLAEKHLDSPVKRIAVCGGSAASVIRAASGRTDLLIGGDFGYHAMMESCIPLIDAGHFWTEYPVLALLSDRLQDKGLELAVFPREKHEYCLRYRQI